ncbi:hypothetical protein K1719_023310 [Acacia pycnantha]|nr:hypothetical protein K1719_023310 [Acacia pycnantha]
MLCPNDIILSCSLYTGPHPLSFPYKSSSPVFPFITPSASLITSTKQMAKLGKLTKLKSAISRWPSFPKLGGRSATVHRDQPHRLSAAGHNNKQQQPLHAVYVGKSRRRYLVNSDVLEHPVFQELVERSASTEEEEEEYGGAVVVACEVVLFEHLLWMLQNDETQMGSMHELADFYNCAC